MKFLVRMTQYYSAEIEAESHEALQAMLDSAAPDHQALFDELERGYDDCDIEIEERKP